MQSAFTLIPSSSFFQFVNRRFLNEEARRYFGTGENCETLNDIEKHDKTMAYTCDFKMQSHRYVNPNEYKRANLHVKKYLLGLVWAIWQVCPSAAAER